MAGFGNLITIPNVLLASGALAGIGSIVGAVKGADAAKSSAQVQSDAASQAAQAQLEMFNRIQSNLAPYQTAGTNALSSLQALTGTGGKFGAPSPGVPAGTNALIPTTPAVAQASQPQVFTAQQVAQLQAMYPQYFGSPQQAPNSMPVSSPIEQPQQPQFFDKKSGEAVYNKDGMAVTASGKQAHGDFENGGKVKPEFASQLPAWGSSGPAVGTSMSPQSAPAGGTGQAARYEADPDGDAWEGADATGLSKAPQYNALTDAPGHFVPDPNGGDEGGMIWQPNATSNTAMDLAGWAANPIGTAVSKGTDWLTSQLAPNTSQGTKDELGYGTSMLMTGNPLGVIPTVMGGLEAAGIAKGDQNAISYGGAGPAAGGGGSPMSYAGSGITQGTAPGAPAASSSYGNLSPAAAQFIQQYGTGAGYAMPGTSMSPQGMAPAGVAPMGTGDGNLMVPGANAANGYGAVNGNSNPLDSYLTSPYRPMADFNPTMESLEATPGYKFALDQGLKATQNSYAAKGLANSGAALKGAAEYTTGLASQTYQQQFQNYLTQYQQQYNDYIGQNQQIYNMLMGQVSAGQNAAAGAGNFGTQAAQNAGNFSTSGAAATGAGQVGSANALLGGIAGVSNAGNSIVNGLLANQLLQSQTEANKLMAGMYGKAA